MAAPANARDANARTAPPADAPASDPASWRNWTPVSPYLAKDPRPDLSQGMSLKAVEEIEARAQEAQKYALEAESLSQQAQQASQEALAAIERKDRETVTEKCKEAERLAAEAKEVEEKCKAAYDACKKAPRTRGPWPRGRRREQPRLTLCAACLTAASREVKKNRTAASISPAASISASLPS